MAHRLPEGSCLERAAGEAVHVGQRDKEQSAMRKRASDRVVSASRRSLLRKGLSAAAAGAGLSVAATTDVLARDGARHRERLSRGDAALLRFAAAAEILESDFWIQYNELGGVPDREVPGGFGNEVYTEKLENLDEDFPVYIHDNTDDEITHFTFLNAYLQSKGAEPVNLDHFRTLPGSTATGSSGQARL